MNEAINEFELTENEILLSKHLLEDDEGTVIFLFDLEEVVVINEDGSVTLNTEKDVIHFSALMQEMELPAVEEAAVALVNALVERRNSGDLDLSVYA